MPKSIDQLLSVANEYYIYTCGSIDSSKKMERRASLVFIPPDSISVMFGSLFPGSAAFTGDVISNRDNRAHLTTTHISLCSPDSLSLPQSKGSCRDQSMEEEIEINKKKVCVLQSILWM